MIALKEIRAIALGLPEVEEADHWGRPSFRVCGRILATVPDLQHLNVMIDPFDVDGVVREHPDSCRELHWGKEVKGVQVVLGRAPQELVASLLEAAWRRKAPARLRRSR